MLTYGAFVPHPAIIQEEVVGDETKKVAQTVQAMKSLRGRIEASRPETILLFSPHGPVFQDGLALRGGKRLQGSLAQFGLTGDGNGRMIRVGPRSLGPSPPRV